MVYRLPFRTAQHYVARIEWQPQPSWEFDGVAAEISYVAGVGSFSGDTALYGTTANVTYATSSGSITFPISLAGVMAEIDYGLNTGTVDAELYTTAVSHLIARAPRSAMSARAARYKMNARLN